MLRAQTAPASTRRFAITTGSLGLLAVGLLMLVVTPKPADAPIAISVTTTPTVGDASSTGTAALAAGTRPIVGLRAADQLLATPIGEGRFALVSAAGAPTAVGTRVEVRLPSGDMREAHVTVHGGDTVLVELTEAEPGVELADRRPLGHEIVTVLAEPPVTIVLDDLADIDVEEGTAVLDDDGDLVGLCSQDIDGDIHLVEVDPALADASDDTPDDTQNTTVDAASNGG